MTMPALRHHALLTLSAVAVLSSAAAAEYTAAVEVGREVTATDFGGASITAWVVDVYMVSTDAWDGVPGTGDTLLNVYNWNSFGAPEAAFFQSFTGTGWIPVNLGGPFDSEALRHADSFVTIGGFGIDAVQDPGNYYTNLDPNFGGQNVGAPGANAGWATSDPTVHSGRAIETTVGIGTLIGRFSSLDGVFSLEGTTFSATWNQGLGTPGQQAAFTVTPAPGAMTLLGLAGVAGRRRRRG